MLDWKTKTHGVGRGLFCTQFRGPNTLGTFYAISTINDKKIAFGNKEHTTDKKMGVSVLLRLFISSNEVYFQRFHNGPNDPKGNEI